MLYPSVDKILNQVDSKYKLVHVIAEKGKKIQETGWLQMKESDYKNKKELGRALEEVDAGLIKIK